MKKKLLLVLPVVVLLLLSDRIMAQRAGQSVTIRVGTVSELRTVDLNDGSAVGGALVGGTFGAALTRSKKGSGTRTRNAALGAVLDGAASSSSKRPGQIYAVVSSEGTTVQVATEQTKDGSMKVKILCYD